MARPSRPPGFDMTYRPADTAFGPPFVVHLPSIVYLFAALAAVVLVILAEQAEPGSFLYREIVLRGAQGFVGARTVAALLMAADGPDLGDDAGEHQRRSTTRSVSSPSARRSTTVHRSTPAIGSLGKSANAGTPRSPSHSGLCTQ